MPDLSFASNGTEDDQVRPCKYITLITPQLPNLCVDILLSVHTTLH